MTDDVRTTVRSFLGSHIRDSELTDDMDIFADGGVSSLFAVQMVSWVERTFDLPMRPADLDIENFRTVRQITAFIESRQAAPADI